MSKKLLSEAQVRRFQSLASIQPLAEMSYKEEKEETMEEAYDEAAMKDDTKLHEEEDEMMADEVPGAEAAPEAVEADEDEADADVEIDEELVEKFMDAVSTIQQVADALGGEMGEMADEEPVELEDEAPEADLAPAPEEAPEAEDEELDTLEEALRGINYIPSQKEIVKTVAKRVAKRLNEAKEAQAKLNKALGKK